jgi:LPS-assembly lipoprotein
MWSSDLIRIGHLAGVVGLLMFLGSCTVEPLNATRSGRLVQSADGTSQTVQSVMKAITVNPVNERVAQQVRNNLLFELNGGSQLPNGRYNVKMKVAAASRSLAIENDSLSPTSAQVAVTVDYELVDSSTGKPVSGGKRRAVASYDQTPQQFANERALRDAQNRAAKDVALQIRLAIAQALSKI